MIVNNYEDISKLENQEFIDKLPDFQYGIGKIPPLESYLKLSVDSDAERMTLAKMGALVAEQVVPGQKLYFNQALLLGAAMSNQEKYRSILFISASRYGKSYLTGLIGIAAAAIYKKEVRIGGATRDKADIVMEKIVNFMPKTSIQIQNGMIIGDTEESVNKKIARLSTQTSREALAWKTGGSIKMFTMSETSKNTDIAGAGAVGIGGDLQIYDESPLISNANYYTGRRFFAENSNTKLIELGNPLTRNHFIDTYNSDQSFVLHACDVTAILEGRMRRQDFDLTLIPKHTPEYRAYIQALFPSEDQGNGFFTTMPQMLSSFKEMPNHYRYTFMGIDSAYKGADGLIVTIASLCMSTEGDRSWIEINYQEDMKKRYPRWEKDTTFNIALDILKLREKYNVVSCCIDIGLGIHIYEAMRQLAPDFAIEPVTFNSKPTESRKDLDYSAHYAYNLRAEMHLDIKELCENGFVYVEDQYYDGLLREMREIRIESELGKIRVEEKKKIKARLGSSPDYLDSVCLAIRALVMSGIIQNRNEDDALYVE